MKCDKDIDCSNKPVWRVFYTNDFLGGEHHRHKLNYCDKHYNEVNPEHQTMIVRKLEDMDLESALEEARRVTGHEHMLDPEAGKNFTVIMRFRKLRH